MQSILAGPPARVKGAADSTRADDVPAGQPWSNWTDQDFERYEEYLGRLYGTSAADERAADQWAVAHDADPGA